MRKVILFVMFLFQNILETKLYEVKVQVQQGILIGKKITSVFNKRSYYAFYGVPYAQPPVQKLRFKDPVEPKKWKQPYDASVEYHGACAQAHVIHKHGVYGLEDCLYLNIYTPSLEINLNSKLPIIVWTHGYAFMSSLSHIHGGDFFIENEVIFITLTHRIGAFGFLNITETSTNMGLKDIVMALKWIKKNIMHFSGDKNKVTVMGSGSGATFLSLLLMTKAHKLFSKMILQSGSLFDAAIFRDKSKLDKYNLLKKLRENGIKNLKTASTRDIITISQKMYSRQEVIDNQRPLIPFMPTIESKSNKSLLTKTPKEYFDITNHIDKPILIGFNSQESIAEVIPFLHNPHFLKTFENHFKYMVPFSEGCIYNTTNDIYKTVADLIKLEYFQGGVSLENLLRYTSDLHIYPIATTTAGAFVKVKGSAQGDEICYLMKCEPSLQNYLNISSDINNPDTSFIKQIVNMWATFAKLGNPTIIINRKNLTWPQITTKVQNMLFLDKETKIVDTKLENKLFSFWNKLYEKYYSSNRCLQYKHKEL